MPSSPFCQGLRFPARQRVTSCRGGKPPPSRPAACPFAPSAERAEQQASCDNRKSRSGRGLVEDSPAFPGFPTDYQASPSPASAEVPQSPRESRRLPSCPGNPGVCQVVQGIPAFARESHPSNSLPPREEESGSAARPLMLKVTEMLRMLS